MKRWMMSKVTDATTMMIMTIRDEDDDWERTRLVLNRNYDVVEKSKRIA